MGLFSSAQMDKINKTAKKSNSSLKESSKVSVNSVNKELAESSNAVLEYFKDSNSILITSKEQLHTYIDNCIEAKITAIDTETTGLDRVKDCVVGASLYYPEGTECYIPIKHLVPLFEEPYKNQLTYEEVGEEFQRLVDNNVKMIFANADFDLAMIYKDLHVDMCDVCYYDVIIAWRCIKEDEKKNGLKELYNKYCLKGQGEPRKFSDFFSPKLFPYCKPEIAKLYAANDAKITYELYRWQLKFITKGSKTCQKYHMEHIANLVWDIEFPLIKVCQKIHRTGSYIDMDTAKVLNKRYTEEQEKELKILQNMVQEVIDNTPYNPSDKRPFTSGKDFNPQSQPQVKYLLYTLMKIPTVDGKNKESTDKNILNQLNLPITNQILKVRSLGTLIGTFVKKMPNATTLDNRIHAQMKQMGAATGRLSCIAKGTSITLLNGEKAIENVQVGDLAYCYDEFGNLHLSQVTKVIYNGVQECVDIKWQSTGTQKIGHLICTPEHKILLKSGEWVQASNLIRYQKVAHLHRTIGKNKDLRPELFGWNKLFTEEQDVVKVDIFKVSDQDTSKYVVHHKDFNKQNNELSNLQLMTRSEHSRYHTRILMNEGKIKPVQENLPPDFDYSKVVHYGKDNGKYIDVSKKDLIKMIQDVDGKLSHIHMDYNTFKKKCYENDVDFVAEAKKYNPKYYQNRPTLEEFKQKFKEFGGDEEAICEYFHMKSFNYNCYIHDCGYPTNHMIQTVTNVGFYEVYDLEIKDYHNFIANEICVHNCSDPNLMNIPSHADDIRHMFRATPSQNLNVDCEDDENKEIKIELSYYDSVPNEFGEFIKVHDLEIGDKIQLQNEYKETVLKHVLSITDTKDDLSRCELILGE